MKIRLPQMRLVIAIGVVLLSSVAARSQVITYNQAFVTGVPAQSLCDAWNTFRGQLLVYPYISMSITAGSPANTVTCTNQTVIASAAAALRTGTAGSWVDGANTWNVGICAVSGTQWELSVNNNGNCQCGSGYCVRPCIGNNNWGGYGTTCGATNQNLIVVFNAVPPCPVKIIDQPLHAQLCETDSTTFYAVTDSAQAFRWQLNTGLGWVNMVDGGNYSGTTTDILKVKNTTLSMHKYKYRIIATNLAKNCSLTSDSGVLNMIASTNASVIVTAAPDTQICKNQEVVFQTSYTNGGSTPQYRWLLNGKQLQGQVNASLKIDTLEDDDYIQCLFISSGQCVFPTTSAPIAFDVVSQLTPGVSIKVDNNHDGTHTFTATPLYGGTNPKYYWFVNGKMQVGANDPTFTTDALNTWEKVSVGMYSSLDCAEPKYATSNLKTTGITQLAENGIAIFPNPNKGEFTITANKVLADNVTVTVASVAGQVVYTAEVPVSYGAINHKININAAPGIYILTFIGGDVIGKSSFTIK